MYRFIEKRFADEFFETGRLRLSSFAHFHRHADEQRLDASEGRFKLFSRGNGQTFLAELECGKNSYVLCGSMSPSKALMRQFGVDSAIVIVNPTGFADEISNALPGFRGGFDGPCSYQRAPVVVCSLPALELGAPHPKVPRAYKPELTPVLRDRIDSESSASGHFLKHHSFSHQVEYRFVWNMDREVEKFIDIEVPNARRHCMHWSDVHFMVAIDDT